MFTRVKYNHFTVVERQSLSKLATFPIFVGKSAEGTDAPTTPAPTTPAPTTPAPTTPAPTSSPSAKPSAGPSASPSAMPSVSPSTMPSVSPSTMPSVSPSTMPSVSPSAMPSVSPSAMPSVSPSASPSVAPTTNPTAPDGATPSPTSVTEAPSTETPTQTPVVTDMPATDESIIRVNITITYFVDETASTEEVNEVDGSNDNSTSWAELSPEARAYAETLGYNETSWDNFLPVETTDLFWDELTPEQQEAAAYFGFDQVRKNFANFANITSMHQVRDQLCVCVCF